MSLLPDFNDKFIDLLYEKVKNEPPCKDRWRSPEWWACDASVRVLKDLLNPDLNPLTFEEVKAWFDRKVEDTRGKVITFYKFEKYSDIYEIHNHYIKINSLYWLKDNGFSRDTTYNSPIIKYDSNLIFSHFPKGVVESPLELFCQMKGYANH